MMRLIFILGVLLMPPTAASQARFSDFAGLWESSGPRAGPAAERRPAGSLDRLPESDGSSPIGPGSPPPRRTHTAVSAAEAALGLEMGDIHVRNMMTPAGRARFAQFKPAEHPMYNCISPGLPTVMAMPGLQDWQVSADALTIRQDVWPEARTVALSSGHRVSTLHTRQGQAYAEIRDGALIITTTNLTEAWGGLSRNAPGSSERTVVETYRLADANTIQGFIEITDPTYLTQTLRLPVRLQRASGDVTFETFPCDPHAARLGAR